MEAWNGGCSIKGQYTFMVHNVQYTGTIIRYPLETDKRQCKMGAR